MKQIIAKILGLYTKEEVEYHISMAVISQRLEEIQNEREELKRSRKERNSIV